MEVRGRPGHGMEVRHHPPDDLAKKAADEARVIPGEVELAGGGESFGRPASRSEKTRLPGSPPPTEIVSTEPPSTLAQVRARLSEVNSQPGVADQATEVASGNSSIDDEAASRRGLVLGGENLSPIPSSTVEEVATDNPLSSPLEAPPPIWRGGAKRGEEVAAASTEWRMLKQTVERPAVYKGEDYSAMKNQAVRLTVDAAVDSRVSLVGDASSYAELLEKIGVPDYAAPEVLQALRMRVAHYMAEGIRVNDASSNPDQLTAEDTLWLLQQARFFANRRPLEGQPDYKNYLEGEVQVIEPSKSEDEVASKPEGGAQSSRTATQIVGGEPAKAGDLIDDSAQGSESGDSDEGPYPHGDGPKPPRGSAIPFTEGEMAGSYILSQKTDHAGEAGQVPNGGSSENLSEREESIISSLEELLNKIENGSSVSPNELINSAVALQGLDTLKQDERKRVEERVRDAFQNPNSVNDRMMLAVFLTDIFQGIGKTPFGELADRANFLRKANDLLKLDEVYPEMRGWFKDMEDIAKGNFESARNHYRDANNVEVYTGVYAKIKQRLEREMAEGESKVDKNVGLQQDKADSQPEILTDQERTIKDLLIEIGFMSDSEGLGEIRTRNPSTPQEIFNNLTPEVQKQLEIQVQRQIEAGNTGLAPDSPQAIAALVWRRINNGGLKPEQLGEVYYAVGSEVFNLVKSYLKKPEDKALAEKARSAFEDEVKARREEQQKGEVLSAEMLGGEVGDRTGQLEERKDGIESSHEQRVEEIRLRSVDRLLQIYGETNGLNSGERRRQLSKVVENMFDLGLPVDQIYSQIERSGLALEDRLTMTQRYSLAVLDYGTQEQIEAAKGDPEFARWLAREEEGRRGNIQTAEIILERGTRDAGDRRIVENSLIEARATEGQLEQVLTKASTQDAAAVRSDFYKAIRGASDKYTWVREWRKSEGFRKWEKSEYSFKEIGKEIARGIGRRLRGERSEARTAMPTGNEPRVGEETSFAPVLPKDYVPESPNIESTMSLQEMDEKAKELQGEISGVLAKVSEGEFGEKSGKNLMGYLEGLTEVEKAVDYTELSREIKDALDSTPSVTPRAAISDAALTKLNELIDGGDGQKAIRFIDVLMKTSLGARGIVGIEEDRLKALREALERGDI